MLHAYATGDLFGVRLTTVLDYLIGEDNLFLGDFDVFFFVYFWWLSLVGILYVRDVWWSKWV